MKAKPNSILYVLPYITDLESIHAHTGAFARVKEPQILDVARHGLVRHGPVC